MYRINNAIDGQPAEVLLYGEIGDEFGGVDATAFYNDVSAIDAPEIIFRISSYGGDVFAGYAVSNIIKRLDVPTVTTVDGVAASIASVILMAGDRVEMSENSMLMLHNSWTSVAVAGDARAMDEAAEGLQRMQTTLRAIDDGIVSAYASRVDVGEDQIRAWMDAETWFTASEAVGFGFADGIADSAPAIAACYVPDGRYKNTPRHLLQSQRIVRPEETPQPAEATSYARRSQAAARLRMDPKLS